MKSKIAVLLKFYKGEFTLFDAAALETALRLGGDITVFAMAPPSVEKPLESLTRLGVRARLITDAAYAGADTLATGRVLAAALSETEPDYIFCGRQSADGSTAQVPPMLAQMLGYSFIGRVMSVDGVKLVTRDGESELKSKSVVTFERCCELRFPSLFSKAGTVEISGNEKLKIPPEKCGLKGSPTQVLKTYESAVGRRSCKFTDAGQLGRLIEEGLKKRAAEDITESGEKLKECYFAGNIGDRAKSIAERAIRLDTDGKTAEDIAELIGTNGIRTLLWEADARNCELAARTAAITESGLCADCISFRVQSGKLVFTRPAHGGSITADIVCNSRLGMATVRCADSAGSDVIFSVGRGGVRYIDKIKRLAERYNAELCCSRTVVDDGAMPYAAQVGLTGRTVSPKVYVAFGISGAVQHTCTIDKSGTVIAVNCDRSARIFDYADFGIADSIENL